jgi:hypothetical protein
VTVARPLAVAAVLAATLAAPAHADPVACASGAALGAVRAYGQYGLLVYAHGDFVEYQPLDPTALANAERANATAAVACLRS